MKPFEIFAILSAIYFAQVVPKGLAMAFACSFLIAQAACFFVWGG